MTERPLPSETEVRSWIRDRSNWGRWGPDDQRGTINLITPEKRAPAARLFRTGRSVSLSRPFPKEPGINNAFPAQHFMRTMPRGHGRLRGRLLRDLLPRRRVDPHRRPLPHVGRARDVERPRPEAGDHLRRRDLRVGGALARGHHDPGRPPRRAAPPRRALGDPRSPGPRLGAGGDPGRSRPHASSRATRSWSTPGGRPGRRRTRRRRTAARSAAAPSRGRGSTCRACPSSVTTTWRSSSGTCSTTCPSATTSRGRCTRRSSPTGCRCSTTRCWSRSPTACLEEGRDEFMLVIAPLPVVGGTGSPANPLAVF